MDTRRRPDRPEGRGQGAGTARVDVGAGRAADAWSATRCACGQVLTNLVSNAVKFTERGEVGRAASSRWSGRRDGVRAALRGPRHRHRHDGRAGRRGCSRPSPRPTARRRASYGGTGLGLAICRRLVELMGGRIWRRERAGRGQHVLFTVRLGVRPGAAAPRSACPADLRGSARAGGRRQRQRAREILGELLSALALAGRRGRPRPRRPSPAAIAGRRRAASPTTSSSWTGRCRAWTASRPRAASSATAAWRACRRACWSPPTAARRCCRRPRTLGSSTASWSSR